MTKKVAAVGIEIPGTQFKYLDVQSRQSLLDFDAAVIDPRISPFYGSYCDTYMGKLSLSDHNSFLLRGQLEHWRGEILQAVRDGKTVFVFLNELDEVYVATGREDHSGTGRNRRRTRYVEIISNYSMLPCSIGLVNAKGDAMRLTDDGNLLTPYWSKAGVFSEYRVLVGGEELVPLVKTRTGGKTVGCLIRWANATGALVLLPYLNFRREEFLEWNEDEEDEVWTKEALGVGAQFASDIIAIHKVIGRTGEMSVAPEWVSAPEYELQVERKMRKNILSIDSRIRDLHSKKADAERTLGEETLLKGLLYEKGPRLEQAILEALRIIGFRVSRYREGESEFDVVIESEFGRMLGEAEGKDARQINIDKYRQLEANLHEDFDRDEIQEMAKGVLIGNAYRLTEPDSRKDFFTTKCMSAACRTETALLRSIDLFDITQFLAAKKDRVFAKKCRRAIFEAVGLVQFPPIPSLEEVKARDKDSGGDS